MVGIGYLYASQVVSSSAETPRAGSRRGPKRFMNRGRRNVRQEPTPKGIQAYFEKIRVFYEKFQIQAVAVELADRRSRDDNALWEIKLYYVQGQRQGFAKVGCEAIVRRRGERKEIDLRSWLSTYHGAIRPNGRRKERRDRCHVRGSKRQAIAIRSVEAGMAEERRFSPRNNIGLRSPVGSVLQGSKLCRPHVTA
jgi:hypothetical protein